MDIRIRRTLASAARVLSISLGITRLSSADSIASQSPDAVPWRLAAESASCFRNVRSLAAIEQGTRSSVFHPRTPRANTVPPVGRHWNLLTPLADGKDARTKMELRQTVPHWEIESLDRCSYWLFPGGGEWIVMVHPE
jgi:hypothetical protein